MTTSSVYIPRLASDSDLGLRRVLHRHRFGYWHSSMQVIGDYLSVFGGICAAWYCYRAWSASATSPMSTINMLRMAMLIAALSAFFLRLFGSRSDERSPLDILESEQLIRSVVCVLAIVGAYTCFLDRGAALLLITEGFVLCTFLSQRKLTSSAKVSKRAMHRRPRVAMLGNKYDAVSFGPRHRDDGSDWIWIGNIRKKPAPELVNLNPAAIVLGCWADLDSIVAKHGITDVVVAESEIASSELREVLQDCIRCNLALSVLTDQCFAPAKSAESALVTGVAAWNFLVHAESRTFGAFAKRVFDILLSTALLIFLSPLLLLISVLVALDSPGPILFRHQRVGKNSRAFAIWKFRSMKASSLVYQHSPCHDSDPRLTRIGKTLRRFSLDELPQLFNVIKGEMSLVGPRPEMPFIVDQYGPLERLRLQVLPGMTGLWQISPARAMPIHANMEYDLYYIANHSFFLDLAILFRTFNAVFRGMVPADGRAPSQSSHDVEREASA